MDRLSGATDVTITRVGTNQQYADGWEAVFSAKGSKGGASQKKKAPPPSKKTAGKKTMKKGKK